MKKTMKNKLLLLALAFLPFTGKTQALNLDFENWNYPITDSGLDNRPIGWFVMPPGLNEPSDFGMFYNAPATDAQNGNYALTLSTWYTYTKDLAILKSPYNSRLSSLKGFYKYEENALASTGDTITDTAQISVFLTKWNTNTMHRDTVGTGILDLNTATEYAAFTNNITYVNLTVIPDSIHILIDPSLLRRDPEGPTFIAMGNGESSFLTVDNLSLIDENVAGLEPVANAFSVYPNPVSDFLVIENFTGYATLRDLNGKLLQELALETKDMLSFEKLNAGIYLLQLTNNNNIQNVRVVKK